MREKPLSAEQATRNLRALVFKANKVDSGTARATVEAARRAAGIIPEVAR